MPQYKFPTRGWKKQGLAKTGDAVGKDERGPNQQPKPAPDFAVRGAPGKYASFLFYVSHLEKSLREPGTFFFDANTEIEGERAFVGRGGQFRVDQVAWKSKSGSSGTWRSRKWGKHVAIKTLRPDTADWDLILLEIRVLLHPPIRYHPNIARLLTLGWGPTEEKDTIFPALVMEYAEHGSLHTLQANSSPLGFEIKRSLCLDVTKGLSILHACDVVHGDLKQDNVLVFASGKPECPYTAKLADFGGSVMDLGKGGLRSLSVHTSYWSAPELHSQLTPDGLKRTDIYSLGLLLWQTVIDGQTIQGFELAGKTPQEIAAIKSSDGMLAHAIMSIQLYQESINLSDQEMEVVIDCLAMSIRADPNERDLPHIFAALKTADLSAIPEVLAQARKKGKALEDNRTAATSGLSIDMYHLSSGILGVEEDRDVQQELPGYRPKLPAPDPSKAHFDLERLAGILGWSQQEGIVFDLKRVAKAPSRVPNGAIAPGLASFYLFKCYLNEFGVAFDAEQACYWLLQAAKLEDDLKSCYLAQAWAWRVHMALEVPLKVSREELKDWLQVSILRGHRSCLEDVKELIERSATAEEKKEWQAVAEQGLADLKITGAGIGMPYFLRRQLIKAFDFGDLAALDRQIEQELGENYRFSLSSTPVQTDGCDTVPERMTAEWKRHALDRVYLNKNGDGLLHYAAGMGNTALLRHLLDTYNLDIDKANQRVRDTALVCACRGGQLASAILLIERGANPNGDDSGNYTPLHWLCNFQEHEMLRIATMLTRAGACVDEIRGGVRADVLNIWADWEEQLPVYTSPLGRAVLMRSLPAVMTLLCLGADPCKNKRPSGSTIASPLELAATLTLPVVLDALLTGGRLDADRERVTPVLLSVSGMLRAAHERQFLPTDVLSLHSRLVRCGPNYKTFLERTLKTLEDLHEKTKSLDGVTPLIFQDFPILHAEVILGNVELVRLLLGMGYNANASAYLPTFAGTRPLWPAEFPPIFGAVFLNHESMFWLLLEHGADVFKNSYLRDGRPLTLVEAAASRDRNTRPGLSIMKHLLRAGLAVDRPSDGVRSAFASAVINRDFALASLLLEQGADINFLYQGADSSWKTVLGETLQTQREESVESLEYLLAYRESNTMDDGSRLSSGTPPAPTQEPSFIVDATNNLSALQLLVLCMPVAQRTRLQVSTRMASAILSAFPKPEQINLAHADFGTALCVAAARGQRLMVEMLLQHGADPALASSKPVPLLLEGRGGGGGEGEVEGKGAEEQQTAGPGTPLELATMELERAKKTKKQQKETRSVDETIQRFEHIVRMLTRANEKKEGLSSMK